MSLFFEVTNYLSQFFTVTKFVTILGGDKRREYKGDNSASMSSISSWIGGYRLALVSFWVNSSYIDHFFSWILWLFHSGRVLWSAYPVMHHTLFVIGLLVSELYLSIVIIPLFAFLSKHYYFSLKLYYCYIGFYKICFVPLLLVHILVSVHLYRFSR